MADLILTDLCALQLHLRKICKQECSNITHACSARGLCESLEISVNRNFSHATTYSLLAYVPNAYHPPCNSFIGLVGLTEKVNTLFFLYKNHFL